MGSIIGKTFGFLWKLLRFVLIPAGILIGFVFLLIAVYYVIWFLRGYRRPHGEHNYLKKSNFLFDFFYRFPAQYVTDLYNRSPEYFTHQGCIVFTGRQGQGKTIAMVHQAMQWQHEFPKAKCISNLAYTKQDATLDNWTKLIDYKNGIQGVICLIDEMQNWFSSNQSKNFPPEMLEVITQNRKNRRVIMGTSQVFTRLAKPIREQATEVRKCFTFFGCITFVHRVEPELDSSGEVVKWKHRGLYYFVHTPELRDSYDTYQVIESFRKSGFQEIVVPGDVIINQTFRKAGKK